MILPENGHQSIAEVALYRLTCGSVGEEPPTTRTLSSRSLVAVAELYTKGKNGPGAKARSATAAHNHQHQRHQARTNGPAARTEHPSRIARPDDRKNDLACFDSRVRPIVFERATSQRAD